MSGAVSVPFAALSMFLVGWSKWFFAVLAIACVIYASYTMWAHERSRVCELESVSDDKAWRRAVREKLGEFLGMGNNLYVQAKLSDGSAAIGIPEWVRSAENFIRQNLGVADANRFVHNDGLPSYILTLEDLPGYPVATIQKVIVAHTDILKDMISALQ